MPWASGEAMKKSSDKLSQYASLFEDIKAAQVMVSRVVTVAPDRKISYAKEMMKIKKISGMPVVDEKRMLIGIISIEDIIRALETNRINEPVRTIMSTQVVSIHVDENLASIVAKFENYKFHRFPVVDNDNRVRGIIAQKDILHGILEKFNLIYIHDQKRQNTLNTDHSVITGEMLNAAAAAFHSDIDTVNVSSAGTGASILQKFLEKKKLDNEIIRRIGVCTYEAETNVVIHSKGTGHILCFIDEDRIIVRVIDNGIGIEDLDRAMRGGFSTAPDYVREWGFGAGMGIPNMKRFSDKLVILSEKKTGTQVEMIFYLTPQTIPST